jgi:hypothetical protein
MRGRSRNTRTLGEDVAVRGVYYIDLLNIQVNSWKYENPGK